ncbi:hypothetical protein [Flavivirga spongiicola]|uniref:Glycosyl-4,4'-diaponeurosporenoate acyltransferase n=1 Tax=Flavivirga spongiicola TaxID=421621 RepID=A0ABU7XYA9_9FLAO|nr:hypothetical protein [Flavivirga sp. MEBiC05379]MDO5980390.1 hypothetical protein [Flavivirga sp. MEBiC05379]
MKEFLKKIKLLDTLETDLDISKQEFVSRFELSVDKGSTDLFSDMYDVLLRSSEKMYKGRVGLSGFEIKKRHQFFNSFVFAKAKGSYVHKGNKLRVITEINGWNDFMYFFFGIASLFYLLFFSSIIQGNAPLLGVLFCVFHALFMFFIPIRMMRASVKKIKYDLEREFHYIASKSLNNSSN